MGRRSHSQTLNLWANGEYVGRWTVDAAGNSELSYLTSGVTGFHTAGFSEPGYSPADRRGG
jgi:hypothetical protein